MMPEASTVGADPSVEELRRELAEAREQQAATAAILAAISNSSTDPLGVFAEIAASAARLCDADTRVYFRSLVIVCVSLVATTGRCLSSIP
jgi:hypothetical protein